MTTYGLADWPGIPRQGPQPWSARARIGPALAGHGSGTHGKVSSKLPELVEGSSGGFRHFSGGCSLPGLKPRPFSYTRWPCSG